MKHFKRAAALMLTLCALLALTACGSLQDKVESKLWETAAPALVQGNMDLLYKGACDETYLKLVNSCLLYTSDAADDLLCVDLGVRRIIKKKNLRSSRRLTNRIPGK